LAMDPRRSGGFRGSSIARRRRSRPVASTCSTTRSGARPSCAMPTPWRANRGAPGTDGVTFVMIAAAGLEEWLAGIRQDLQATRYRPAQVRREMIPNPPQQEAAAPSREEPGPKGRGGAASGRLASRRSGTGVQTAAKLVLEPIFEADLKPSAFGYRPRRSRLARSRKPITCSVRAILRWWMPTCRNTSTRSRTAN
jgi:hypothetical protein